MIVAACPGQVSITWIGQACFVVRSPEGTVVTDPPAASIGYSLPPMTANAVTISHNHPDHNNFAAVSGNPTLVDGRATTARQEIAAPGSPFALVPGFHDNTNGSERGPNTIIRWTQGGIRFAHLGDLGQNQLTAEQIAELVNTDVLFVPAGGGFTITPDRAAQYVRELQPRVAILMHYRTAFAAIQIAALPAAAAPFARVTYKPSTVELTQATLPAATQSWVMLPASNAVAANAASFADGLPVAPGSVISMFGTFTGSATGANAGFPLSRRIGETELLVDGSAVPLYYVSSRQVNAQVPSSVAEGQVIAEVRVGGQSVGRAPLTVVGNAPGLFAAVNQNGATNSAASPARRGEALSVFGTGIGAVTPPVEDGAAAGVAPLSTGAIPNVFLSDRQLQVEFSGLAPGFAGLWQINVRLPADGPSGENLPLTVTNGLTSNVLRVTVIQ
jgi:uncharacterized protein (TIGR03437 family)